MFAISRFTNAKSGFIQCAVSVSSSTPWRRVGEVVVGVVDAMNDVYGQAARVPRVWRLLSGFSGVP